MPVIVVTRAKVKWWHVPAWLWLVLRVSWQAMRAPGFIRGGVWNGLNLDGGTVTVWESGRAMAAYRNGGTHGRVMGTWARYLHAATFTVWTSDSDEKPSWREVERRLVEEGRWLDSPVAPAERIREDHPVHFTRLGFELPLKPVRRRIP